MTVAELYPMAAPAVIIDIELLGPFRVRSDGHDIPLTPTQELVLLVLTVADGHPVDKHTLQRRVFDREPDQRTEQNLRRQIADLRDKLGSASARGVPGATIIVTGKLGAYTAYRLNLDLTHIDAHTFEQQVAAGTAALHTGCQADAAARFQAADALWRSDPLPNLSGRPFTAGWASRLSNWRQAAVRGHAEALIRLGRHREAIPPLHSLTVGRPGDSGLWQLLVVALYADRRDGDAARTLHNAITAFRDEGLDPSFFRQLQHEVLSLSLPRDGSRALDALGLARRPAPPDARPELTAGAANMI